ncbi:MAG: hypothetical protein R2761_21510 [Acidimicrobiales bacterium]
MIVGVRPGGDGIDDGRRRRGRILTAIGAVIALLALANVAIGRRIDHRVDALQADLVATFADTTSLDLLHGTVDSPSNRMDLNVPAQDDLSASDGTIPDLITVAGGTVQARYTVGGIGGGRCLVATWTQSSFAVVDGSDRQCGASLTLD